MELLSKLYAIHSPSGKEKPIRKFIRKWVESNIEGVELHYDNVGNMYFTKGECDTYPCVVAHLDQVQHKHSADFETFVEDGIIYGWSPSTKTQEGLGADDKNGVWIALKCLQRFDVLKVAFFNSEEVGCVGSASAEMDFFKDCRFVIQPDRKHANDLITEICWAKICSDEFVADLDAELYGYKAKSGLMTDVEKLCERGIGLSCINVSCGYYNPHTDRETTCISDLVNCYNFIAHIIEKCTKVYPHTYEEYGCYYGGSYGGYKYGGSSKSYNYYGDKRVYPRAIDWDDYGYYDNYPYYADDRSGETYDDNENTHHIVEPYIPDAFYYNTVKEWIDDVVGYNFENYFPEDLWPFVEDLLEGVMLKDTFVELAYESWNEYYDYL